MTPISSSPYLRSTLAAATLALTAATLSAQIGVQAGVPPGPLHVSTLPATSPTAPPTPNALPAPIAATPGAAPTPSNPAHRATVTYAAGLLDVRADNSSLNQILRSIARLTGMTITGGVADERVFGNYGPAEPSTILATLLDGTGSNMVLHESIGAPPTELILTPRNGGATPPNPNAAGFDDGPDEDAHDSRPFRPRGAPGQTPPLPQRFQSGQQSPSQQSPVSGPQSMPQPMNNVNGSPSNTSPTASTYPTTNSVPLDTVPTPSTTPSTAGIVDAPNPPPPGSTTSTAPNGAATPEQIYQQLLQLQQKQQQPASTTPSLTTPSTTTPPQ